MKFKKEWFGIFLLSFFFFTPFLAAAATVSGTANVPGAKDSGDAVIYIDAISGAHFEPPTAPAVMDQIKKVYTPHVLPILKGTEVEFVNSDPIFHNVHGYQGKNTLFNFAMPLQGQKMKRKIDADGVILILCDLHQEMSAYILILPTPYFSKTDSQGNYKIEGVPDGNYILKGWHENGTHYSQPIHLTQGQDLTVNLTLKK